MSTAWLQSLGVLADYLLERGRLPQGPADVLTVDATPGAHAFPGTGRQPWVPELVALWCHDPDPALRTLAQAAWAVCPYGHWMMLALHDVEPGRRLAAVLECLRGRHTTLLTQGLEDIIHEKSVDLREVIEQDVDEFRGRMAWEQDGTPLEPDEVEVMLETLYGVRRRQALFENFLSVLLLPFSAGDLDLRYVARCAAAIVQYTAYAKPGCFPPARPDMMLRAQWTGFVADVAGEDAPVPVGNSVDPSPPAEDSPELEDVATRVAELQRFATIIRRYWPVPPEPLPLPDRSEALQTSPPVDEAHGMAQELWEERLAERARLQAARDGASGPQREQEETDDAE